MSVFTVPLLVTHRPKAGYTARCLFLPELYGQHSRYETALAQLRQGINVHFRQVHSCRGELDERLWLTFQPDFRFVLEPVAFESGRRWVDGLFAVAYFELKGRHYACLPLLDGLIADIGASGDDRTQRHEALLAHLQYYFRKRREEDPDFEADTVLSHQGDSVAELEISLQLRYGPFPFQHEESLFARANRGIGDGPEETDRVARDLNALYPDHLISARWRDELVGTLEHLAYGHEPGPFVLVGPPGCGKTAALHETIRRYLKSQAGKPFDSKVRVWHLDPLRVISGMSVVGQWQRRMEVVLNYIRRRPGSVRPDLLYCDNLIALQRIGKSAQNSLTIADLLRPHLEKRTLGFIGEATPEAWQKVQETDRRFADLFRVIRVDPPPRPLAVQMIAWQRVQLEQQHECTISGAAVAELLKMERRFAAGEALPGAAVRVLQRLAARYPKQAIGAPEVLAAFASSHHFREEVISRHTALAAGSAEAHFAERLIGQQAARAALADVVYLIKSGLAPLGKPMASLLFIGPTGVGKTEAAKLLADYLFTANGLVRFDMNEYVDGSALGRLIGDAWRPDGQLTSEVRQRRACVLLFDEIEKAHPAIHDLLLQVLGEGRLTDALGRTTDFTQCVIVLTSNLGATAAGRNTGFTRNAADTAHTYREAVERFFRPEFLNRIDQTVVFTPLSADDVAAVARLQLTRLLSREGFVRRLTFLNVHPDALRHVVSLGYDPLLGARALKRSLERALTAPVARQLANVDDTKPMVLDVVLENGALTSSATLLDYAPSKPAVFPDFDHPGRCRDLLDAAADLRRDLRDELDAADDEEHRRALHTLQAQLDYLREELDTLGWDIEDALHRQGGAARWRKTPRLSTKNWRSCELGPPVVDRLAIQDVSDFFEELYARAERQAAMEQQALGWALRLDQLYRQLAILAACRTYGRESENALKRGQFGANLRHVAGLHNESSHQNAPFPAHLQPVHRKSDRLPAAAGDEFGVCLQAVPLQTATGFDAAAATLRQFDALLASYGAHPLAADEAQAADWLHHGISCHAGPGLAELLQREVGIHLWYHGCEQTVPVALRVHRLAAGCDVPARVADLVARRHAVAERPHPGAILRLYHLTDEGCSVSDLQSGLVRKASRQFPALDADDWRYLRFDGRLAFEGPAR